MIVSTIYTKKYINKKPSLTKNIFNLIYRVEKNCYTHINICSSYIHYNSSKNIYYQTPSYVLNKQINLNKQTSSIQILNNLNKQTLIQDILFKKCLYIESTYKNIKKNSLKKTIFNSNTFNNTPHKGFNINTENYTQEKKIKHNIFLNKYIYKFKKILNIYKY